MNYWLPLIFGVVVGLVLGAVVTLLLTNNKETPPAPTPPPPPPVEKLPAGISRKQHTELLRLWRDRAAGGLMVEADGKILPDASQLNTEQQQAMSAVIREWALWLGLGKAAPKPEVSAPTPAAEPVRAAAPVAAVPAAAVTPPIVPILIPVPEKKPGSMVEQIDEIVQDMLPNSPLAGHKLRVRSDPKEGVVVLLDNQRFYGIGEVSEPQAKALLQTAVAEWERRAARERGWN